MMDQPETILNQLFGYQQFKPLQKEIIANVLKKRDTLVIMPTGGGKSLCYQIPALIFEGLTVVVSPLISLMKDQVEQLTEIGIPAVFLNSSLSSEAYQENMDSIRRREVKLLYVAPETLLTPRLMTLLASVRVDCFTIDEAHCISEWGHDFRPEYRQLLTIRDRFPAAVCIALTATATPRVRADIKKSLRLETSNEFIASFDRPNLYLEINPKQDGTAQTIQFIRRFPKQSGIVYCFSRRQVDELAAELSARGFSVRPYHAGLTDEERKTNQELFIRDDVQIIVATIAFGMGINKPNVRFVIHHDLPKSIESYYQEIGRAGRDGLPAHCLLLFSYADKQKIMYFIREKIEPEKTVARQHLNMIIRYVESEACRRIPLLAYFGEQYRQSDCGACDYCRKQEVIEEDITTPALMFLSCVKRTDERFPVEYVIDVLLGKDSAQIQKQGHNHLSTYGIGKEFSRQQWLSIAGQLVQKSFLVQDKDFGTLQLTPEAYTLFKTRETVMGTLQAGGVEEKTGLNATLEYDQALFELLREKRKQLANEANVPPYVIFSDRTLIEMAAYLPASKDQLKRIFGIGSVKLEKFGNIFIQLISAYAAEHKLKPGVKPPRIRRGKQVVDHKPRYIVVGEAYNNGRSISEIMRQFMIQQNTVLDHLYNFAAAGNPLRRDGLASLTSISQQQQQNVLAAFAKLGTQQLGPVYEELNQQVAYDDLKILRLCYLSTD